jgi:hypothetical protein
LRRASGFDVIAPVPLARGRLVARRLQPGVGDRRWRASSVCAPTRRCSNRVTETAPQSRLDRARGATT